MVDYNNYSIGVYNYQCKTVVRNFEDHPIYLERILIVSTFPDHVNNGPSK